MSIKVFYIDDEEMLCENFDDQFSSDEVEVFTFTDPEESLRRVDEIKPDIMFIDYRFPDMTGDDVAHRMPEEIPKALVSGDIKLNPSYRFIEQLQKPASNEKIQQILDSVQHHG